VASRRARSSRQHEDLGEHDVSSFIVNVTFDCHDPKRLSDFWAGVTGYARIELTDDFARLHAPDSRGVRQILFFKVPEPKSTKNRVHVDLASKTPEQEIERLKQLGAAEVYRMGELTKLGWVTMSDPEGNEFCIG
jgi:predicted enzyme related to lactoylglutathione lyase